MKVTVVGAGNVGATCANVLATREVANEIVLLDIKENYAEGKALDMWETSPINMFDSRLIGSTNDYTKTAGSEVVVITSGIPRKPGMSRDDLIATNAGIVKSVTEQVVKHSPDAVIIIVSNPLDVMTYAAFLTAKVSGIPVTELVAKDKLDAIIERTKKGGGEIVNLLGTSGYYAPGAAAAQMVEAIVKDQKRIFPVCSMLQGEYGMKDIYLGVPVKLGKQGIEEIIELQLNEEEKSLLTESAEHVRAVMKTLDDMGLF